MPRLSTMRLPRKIFSARELRYVVGGPHGLWPAANGRERKSARIWPDLERAQLDHSVVEMGQESERVIAVGEAAP